MTPIIEFWKYSHTWAMEMNEGCAIAHMSSEVGLPRLMWCSFSFEPTPCSFSPLFREGGGVGHRFNLKTPPVTTKVDVLVTTANYIMIQIFAMMCLGFHSYRHPLAYCDPHGYNNVYVGYALHLRYMSAPRSHTILMLISYSIGDLVTKLRGN